MNLSEIIPRQWDTRYPPIQNNAKLSKYEIPPIFMGFLLGLLVRAQNLIRMDE
jgi:hypothetical protein